MLSLQDCVDCSELSEAEIEIIAEHEHVPQIIAAELAFHLLHTPDGMLQLQEMMRESILKARSLGHTRRAFLLLRIYRHFIHEHHNTSYLKSVH